MKTILLIISMLFLGTGISFSQENLKWVTSTYTPAMGLGPEENIKLRDPSDIIKVGSLYYVWYWKVGLNVRWATSYATSPDGYTWTEKGEVLPSGKVYINFEDVALKKANISEYDFLNKFVWLYSQIR